MPEPRRLSVLHPGTVDGIDVKQSFATYAAIIQIVAILLLQCYPLASHMGRMPAQPKCRGNHAECGCAPERIAARACCCYQHKPVCCDKDGGHEEEDVAGRGKGPSSPQLSAAPCGGSTKYITASLDKLKFVRPDALLADHPGCSLSPFHPFTEIASSRFTEPPELPPKAPLFS